MLRRKLQANSQWPLGGKGQRDEGQNGWTNKAFGCKQCSTQRVLCSPRDQLDSQRLRGGGSAGRVFSQSRWLPTRPGLE